MVGLSGADIHSEDISVSLFRHPEVGGLNGKWGVWMGMDLQKRLQFCAHPMLDAVLCAFSAWSCLSYLTQARGSLHPASTEDKVNHVTTCCRWLWCGLAGIWSLLQWSLEAHVPNLVHSVLRHNLRLENRNYPCKKYQIAFKIEVNSVNWNSSLCQHMHCCKFVCKKKKIFGNSLSAKESL